jgi:glutamate 5-kinase
MKTMKNSETLVAKVGTNVVTRKNAITDGPDVLDLNVMADLANQIAEIIKETHKRVILVTSGAVAAGKSCVRLNGDAYDITRKQAYAMVGQPLLMSAYNGVFSSHKLIPGQGLLTSNNFNNETESVRMLNVLKALPENVVPVINENDFISTEELSFGDNDQLASEMAQLVRAETLILLTDVDGVYDKNPSIFQDAKLLDQIKAGQIDASFLQACGGSGKSKNGTGGMASKLTAAKKAAESGIPAFIANGKCGNNLLNIALHSRGGTKVIL